MIRYSVIIPHFDQATRLERLLRTLPVSRGDIEVIVVDDCSPDPLALQSLQRRWPIVRWLSTDQNSGAGAARNVGLYCAIGEYLVFADSDDEFLPGAFEVFDVNVGPEDELVYFFADAVQEVDGSASNRADRANELCRRYLERQSDATFERLALGHVVPWGKVYSRRFIERCDIAFDEIRVSNDVAFNVLAAVQARRVRVVPLPVYRVFRREGGLTTQEDTGSLTIRVRALARLNRRLESLSVPARMHAGSHIYRAFWKGPKVFLWIGREAAIGGLIWPIVKRLSLGEVLRFVWRFRQARRERDRFR